MGGVVEAFTPVVVRIRQDSDGDEAFRRWIRT